MDPENYIQDYYRQRRANDKDRVITLVSVIALFGCMVAMQRYPKASYALAALLVLQMALLVRNKLRLDRWISAAKQAQADAASQVQVLPGVPMPPGRMTGTEGGERKVNAKVKTRK